MSVKPATVVGGLIGGILFLLLVGAATYFLKRRCSACAYEELGSSPSPVCNNSTDGSIQLEAPLTPASVHSPAKSCIDTSLSRTNTIPFIVPPTFHGRDWIHLDNEERGNNAAMGALYLNHSIIETMGTCTVGAINPDLYKFPEDDSEMEFPEGNIGRLWFAVHYEQETERLLVTLIKARNLCMQSDTSNPFVKIYLLPDERRHLQTKGKHKTNNPQFNESFLFQVSSKTLSERILKLSIYNIDREKKHRHIGDISFPLKHHSFGEETKIVLWRDLETEDSEVPSEYGDLQFSLSYNDYLGRLTVVVLRAKGLKLQEEGGNSNAYVKVSLMNHNKFLKSKKTGVVVDNSSPVFNKTFSFKLDQLELDTASLSLTVYQNMEEKGSWLVGRVVVGPFMYTRGKELEHWNQMINKPKELVKEWHVLSKGS